MDRYGSDSSSYNDERYRYERYNKSRPIPQRVSQQVPQQVPQPESEQESESQPQPQPVSEAVEKNIGKEILVSMEGNLMIPTYKLVLKQPTYKLVAI